jgi:hypothetical protein
LYGLLGLVEVSGIAQILTLLPTKNTALFGYFDPAIFDPAFVVFGANLGSAILERDHLDLVANA